MYEKEGYLFKVLFLIPFYSPLHCLFPHFDILPHHLYFINCIWGRKSSGEKWMEKRCKGGKRNWKGKTKKKEMEKRRSLNLTGVEKLKGAIKNCWFNTEGGWGDRVKVFILHGLPWCSTPPIFRIWHGLVAMTSFDLTKLALYWPRLNLSRSLKLSERI